MRTWTDSQKRVIESQSERLLVSAGAGSGKTAVMIERIRALLAAGEDLKNMVVCTFTKAAAADMKRKLAEVLAASDDPWLRRQLRRLPCADISTLHSFCAHLIKAWFFDTDLDPEFAVMEEGEAAALKAETAEELIAEQKETGDETFAGLYAVFLSGRSHRRLRNALLSVYDYARAQPDFHGWLTKSATKSDGEYRRTLFAQIDASARKLEAQIHVLAQDMRAARFSLDETEIAELAACVRQGVPCALPTPVLRGKPEYRELHERFKACKATHTELCRKREEIAAMPSHEQSLPYCRALAALTERFEEKYREKKRARGKADYSDLEHEALGILSGPHGAEIVSEYKYVFVDEYQDISPLQEEILKKFTCRLFFVGDVKQSIYGFRMCRPTFFLQKRDAYRAGDGEAVELTDNFRSGNEIVRTVNEVFSAVMTRAFGGTDYADETFTARVSASSAVKAVYVDVPEEKEEAVPAVYSLRGDTAVRVNRALDAEAEGVANEIAEMLQGEIEDENGEMRPTEFRDIAVLVRSRGAFTDLLEQKLRAMSVPVAVQSADDEADAFTAVSMLLSFLRLLDNARDDVSLTATLLSPMFGKCTAGDLARLRGDGKGAFCDCVFARPADDEALREKQTAFCAQVKELRRLAAETTVADLAGEITARFDCFSYALLLGGEREAAALDAFIESLTALDEHNTLHEYLRYIDRTGMPHLAVADGGNAVRIMTIHASKGLEFPCVILPTLAKRFNLRDAYDSVLCDGEEGIVLRSFDFSARSVCENPRFAVCSRKIRRAQAEEELRILYVAMTRARRKLTLFSVRPEREAQDAEDTVCYIDWLRPFLRPVASAAFTDDRASAAALPPPDTRIVAALKETFSKRYPYARGGAVKASVSGVIRGQEEEEQSPLPVLFSGDDRAALRGSAYHTLMQWADFSSVNAWETIAARFPEEAALADRAEIERAFAAMREFLGGRKFFREKAFVFSCPAAVLGGTGDNVLVQGVIDLLVVSENGDVEIVDYKTGDRAHVESPVYVRQLRLYKKAAEEILRLNARGKRVTGTYLYAFSSGELIKVRTDD